MKYVLIRQKGTYYDFLTASGESWSPGLKHAMTFPSHRAAQQHAAQMTEEHRRRGLAVTQNYNSIVPSNLVNGEHWMGQSMTQEEIENNLKK